MTILKLDAIRLRDRGFAMGTRLIQSIESVIAWGSLVGDRPVLDQRMFPWSFPIEEHWQAIRSELDNLLIDVSSIPPFQQLSREQRVLTTDEGWRTFFFYAYGFKAEANCDRCPQTARWLATIPGMTTAFFSIFAPGKHLRPHRGTFKGLLRYHLALRVPEPANLCALRIDDEIYHWQEGKSLIFDDTYRHEAWNDTTGTRVVLFVDFVRPLRFPANLLNKLVIGAIRHSPFVKDAVANYEAWEARLEIRD